MSQECREMSQECRDVVACRARSLNFTVKRQQSRRLRSTLRHYNRIPPDWGVTCRVLSRISCIQLHGPVPAGAVLLGYGKKSLQKGRCGASCTERTAHIQLSAVRTYSCTSAQPPCCRVVRSDATCSQPVALTPHYHGLSGYRRAALAVAHAIAPHAIGQSADGGGGAHSDWSPSAVRRAHLRRWPYAGPGTHNGVRAVASHAHETRCRRTLSVGVEVKSPHPHPRCNHRPTRCAPQMYSGSTT